MEAKHIFLSLFGRDRCLSKKDNWIKYASKKRRTNRVKKFCSNKKIDKTKTESGKAITKGLKAKKLERKKQKAKSFAVIEKKVRPKPKQKTEKEEKALLIAH